jgi:hypothetical protein
VLPNVLVTPLAVAETDHCFDLGEKRLQKPRGEEAVESVVRVRRNDDFIESGA